MSDTNVQLARPIASLTPAEKARVPISLALAEDGTQVVVSRYEDPIWDFWPYIPLENKADSGKKINWKIEMPDGTLLTDPIHGKLLESCKDFIWSLFANPVEGRKRPKMNSIVGKPRAPLRHLIRWMATRGMTRFAHLEGHTLDYVTAAKKGVSSKTAFERLRLVEDLYHQFGKIDDGLSLHPWPFETAAGLSGVIADPNCYKPQTPRLPDHIVKELAKNAIDYVVNRAKELLDHRDVGLAASTRANNAHYKTVLFTKAVRDIGYRDTSELNQYLITLRTACYIVIAMFSGARDSEILSLGTGCIVHGKSKDGIDLTWLHGKIYKTGERPHKWLVPPIVGEAVHVMERYSELYRSRLCDEEREVKHVAAESASIKRKDTVKHLTKLYRHQDKLFLATGYSGQFGKATAVLSGGSMRDYLVKFCELLGIVGDDGEPWHLSSHQFRRTFAYNYAKSEMGDLLYLQQHFGHRSLDMTLLYSDGGTDGYEADTELLDEILKAKKERQVEILAGIVDSDAPLAAGQNWIGDWRRTVRTAKNKEALIEDLSGTLSLTGTGHSWCAGSAKGTGCGSRCMFEPDMCTECNWAIISQEHLPVWKEIAKQQEQILACEDIGVPGKTMALRILAKAKNTIIKLEGSQHEG